MRLSLIVATDLDGIIGRDNDLPWHLPADLKHFKRTTMKKPIIMGRKTHESIGRALPGRPNLVVSRQVDYAAEGCEVFASVDAAIDAVRDSEIEEAMIIGGATIYAAALPFADRIYQTLVHAHVPGDVSFPPIDTSVWEVVERVDHAADEKNEHDYSFLTWERRTHSS